MRVEGCVAQHARNELQFARNLRLMERNAKRIKHNERWLRFFGWIPSSLREDTDRLKKVDAELRECHELLVEADKRLEPYL